MSAFDEGYKIKNPAASELFDFNFADMKPVGGSIGTPAVTQVSKASKVGGSADLTITNVNLSGDIVQARLNGGTDGEDYRVRATCIDSNSNTLAIEIILQVRTLPFER